MPRDVVTTPIGAVRLGESVRARSGAIGRIVRIVSFRDLDAAARRALPSKLAASADDDFVIVELYAKVPPPPADQVAAAAAGDESFWNWAGIPMFRASFADKLRQRAKKHARAPRTPGLRLRYVSGACGRGALTVGVYWRSMPASALGGRALPRLLAD